MKNIPKTAPINKCYVKKGDVIKLGRVILKIKDCRVETGITKQEDQSNDDPEDVQESKMIPK